MVIGSIVQWSSNTIPDGWLLCDGSAVSRTTYADLFSVIGTTYGSGDGSTTFNLPNYKGRVGVGLDSNDTDFDTLGETGGSKYLQEHTHYSRAIKDNGGDSLGNSGGVKANNSTGDNQGYSQYGYGIVGSVQDVTTGTSGNLQPYLVTNYIIKALNPDSIKISELESVSSVTSSDILPIVQNGETKKVEYSVIQNNIENSIIESGSNSNGNYLKYSDGTMICYGITALTATTSRSAGGLSYYSAGSEVTLPQTFINTSYIVQSTIDMANMNYFAQSYISVTSSSTITVSFASTGQNEQRNIHWLAIGKWK